MHQDMSLAQIRENEKKSHIEMYTNHVLYQDGSWLRKPVRTIMDLLPYFENHTDLRVLDLGCGVGRNCIPVAQHFQSRSCRIDCVDILDFAIDTLSKNARRYGVANSIQGIVAPIEEYPIEEEFYDWIFAISALEHVNSPDSFARKLLEIRNGIRKDGVVCLVINSNVKETEKNSGKEVPAQFEVNLQTDTLLCLLQSTFSDWTVIKSTVQHQCYDIPREMAICELNTDVVTFVAVK